MLNEIKADHVAVLLTKDMSRVGRESEQYELKAEAEVLRHEIETQEQQNQNLEQFIQEVRKYA